MTETSGLATLKSAHSVDETVARIRAILAAKQIREFALIDHSGEAAKMGLAMPKTQVVIFGNPKGGTPLMLAAPECRNRSAAEAAGARGWCGASVGELLVCAGAAGAAWAGGELYGEYRGDRNDCAAGGGVSDAPFPDKSGGIIGTDFFLPI